MKNVMLHYALTFVIENSSHLHYILEKYNFHQDVNY